MRRNPPSTLGEEALERDINRAQRLHWSLKNAAFTELIYSETPLYFEIALLKVIIQHLIVSGKLSCLSSHLSQLNLFLKCLWSLIFRYTILF